PLDLVAGDTVDLIVDPRFDTGCDEVEFTGQIATHASVEACQAPPGFITTGGGCNDTDPARNPSGAGILGHGVDGDCRASTPDTVDADGDGVDLCNDCNDNDATVHPGATEVSCNGVDDDCDSSTIDNPDGDGDGTDVCNDCNDNDASIHPGATELPAD